MGPVCLMKLTRKKRLIRTLGFFLDFLPQLILPTGSWDSLPVHLVTMGPLCLMKLTRKWKLIRTLGFFLDFFPQLISTTGSWDRLPVHLVTMVTMGPVCLMKLTRKQKLVRTLGFFLDYFPSSFRPLEAEIGCLCTWWPWWPWDQCRHALFGTKTNFGSSFQANIDIWK